jgi:hypothetical protein
LYPAGTTICTGGAPAGAASANATIAARLVVMRVGRLAVRVEEGLGVGVEP